MVRRCLSLSVVCVCAATAFSFVVVCSIAQDEPVLEQGATVGEPKIGIAGEEEALPDGEDSSSMKLAQIESNLTDRALSIVKWQTGLFALISTLLIALAGIGQYISYRSYKKQREELGKALETLKQECKNELDALGAFISDAKREAGQGLKGFQASVTQAQSEIEEFKRILLNAVLTGYYMSIAIQDIAVAGTGAREKMDLERIMLEFAMLRIEVGDNNEAAAASDILRALGVARHLERLQRALQRDNLTSETKLAIQQAIDDIRARQENTREAPNRTNG